MTTTEREYEALLCEEIERLDGMLDKIAATSRLGTKAELAIRYSERMRCSEAARKLAPHGEYDGCPVCKRALKIAADIIRLED